MKNYKDFLFDVIVELDNWVVRQNYKGYEPFDGLSSCLRPLTFKNLLLDRILLQLVRQSPINFRPLLGVKPLDSTIGRGYMAWGYCNLYKITGNENYRKKIISNLDWLEENRSPGFQYHCWGKHFDFAGRDGIYYKFEPVLVWTALIGQAYLDAYELLSDPKYLKISDSICRWIVNLPRNRTDKGFCLGYHDRDHESTIHNSNMLGAAMLARTAKHTNNLEYLGIAREAMAYSCSRQLPDGSWFYGEEPMFHWMDNFHTGYNLDALKCYNEYSGDNEFVKCLDSGFEFYKNNFFEQNGRPKYYHSRAYPIDSQCISQAVDTLANFSHSDRLALKMAQRTANWAIGNMRSREGYFYYRQYPLDIKAKTPMLHWAQATMFKALTFLLFRLNGK